MAKHTRVLGLEQVPLVSRLIAVLNIEGDAVRQQQALELVTMQHCVRMEDLTEALAVAEGMHRHVRQLIEQQFGEQAGA